MTLDALDRAFNDGLIDARAAVLPPGAPSWTTLGEAAGLEDEPAPQTQDMPSLSPVALPASSSIAPPSSMDAGAGLDLDLPDGFDELQPRRRGLVGGVIGAAAAVGIALALVGGRLGSSMPAAADVKAAAAVQAPPPAAVEVLPSKIEAPEEKKAEPGEKQELSDWQKRMLLDADKAREEKARAKNTVRADKPAKAPAARARSKSTGGLLEGGDRFDPLNGAL